MTDANPNIVPVAEVAQLVPYSPSAIEKIAKKAKCFANIEGVGHIDLAVFKDTVAKLAMDKIERAKKGRKRKPPAEPAA
jgi:hypothetical protein